jgi:1,4-alpha-glucan branching enzyme
MRDIEKSEGGLDKFSQGYKTMGFQVANDNTITLREWAPAANTCNLVGDFSQFTLGRTYRFHLGFWN